MSGELQGKSDAVLIPQLRSSSREAWDAMYEMYSVAIWRYVARLLGADATAVGDVVQETFLAAARSARQFDASRGTVASWLTGIAHHQVHAHWLRTSRHQHRPLSETDELAADRLFDPAVSWEELFERRQVAEQVRQVLAEISVDYARLLSAKYLENRSLEALAAQAGVSTDAVKMKLLRAREEFRAKFKRLARGESSVRS